MPLTTFRPPHEYRLDENGVSDPETLQLVRDTISVNSSLFQGVPAASWIERRVEALIRSWLPDWDLSHAQVVDLDKQEIQSRSWDLVVHQPVPTNLGLQPRILCVILLTSLFLAGCGDAQPTQPAHH